MKLNRYLATLLVGAAVITACDNTTPPGNGDFSLTASNVSVEQSANGKSTITITRKTAGDVSPITLTLEKSDGTTLPTGISGTFNPAPATGGTSELTISTTDAVAVQSYALRVKGVGNNKTQTATLTLEVKAKAATFSLTLDPATLSIEQGANKPTTVNIARTATTDTTPVTLTLEKADGTSVPAGITATFSPSPANAASSTATVSIGTAVPAAVYNLRIKGVAGTQTKLANLDVTVTAKATPTLDYSIAAAATDYSIAQGASGQGTINITRTPTTDTTAIALVLEKADGTAVPTGITATFNPGPATGASSAMTINVAATVPVATYALRVKGTANSLVKTANINVIVTAKPDFTLALNTAAISVQQGATGAVTANLVRTNLATNVDVTLTGTAGAALPTGITAAPAATTTNSATLTVAVAAGTAAQEYNLEVKAVGGGVTKTTPVKVTVTLAPLPINTGTASIIKGLDSTAIGAGSFLTALNTDTVASYETAINTSGVVTYTLPTPTVDKRKAVLELVPTACTTGTLTAALNTVKGASYNFGALLTGQTTSGGLVLSSANIQQLAVDLEQAFIVWVDGDTTITGSCTGTKDGREYRYTASGSGIALKSGWNVIIAKVTSFGASPNTVSFGLRGAQAIPANFKWRYY